MSDAKGTSPLAMALIFAIVFGAFLIGLKLFVFLITGEISQQDFIEAAALIAAIFIGAFLEFYFQKRK